MSKGIVLHYYKKQAFGSILDINDQHIRFRLYSAVFAPRKYELVSFKVILTRRGLRAINVKRFAASSGPGF